MLPNTDNKDNINEVALDSSTLDHDKSKQSKDVTQLESKKSSRRFLGNMIISNSICYFSLNFSLFF